MAFAGAAGPVARPSSPGSITSSTMRSALGIIGARKKRRVSGFLSCDGAETLGKCRKRGDRGGSGRDQWDVILPLAHSGRRPGFLETRFFLAKIILNFGLTNGFLGGGVPPGTAKIL
jgi:hypothetical protein